MRYVKIITYLIQSVICCDRDRVGVHHQPLPEQCEQTVCVHDLYLPPAGKHTQLAIHKRIYDIKIDIDCHRPDDGLILAGGTMWPCQL